MANTFSVLSLKRNRSASGSSKKESKLNAILNRLANSFHSHNSNKKRKQFGTTTENANRRSSLSAIMDYFRSPEEPDEHPFANDAWFEQHRYKQQKKTSNTIAQNQYSINSHHQNTSILVKHRSPNASLFNTNPQSLPPAPPQRYHHRHTQSAITATTATRRKKASHVRHYSHVSCISASNITVNSEDLTAKEFADIAGIRILSEDDDHDLENDNEYSFLRKKICTFCGDEENEIPSLIITSSKINGNANNSSVHNRSDIMFDQDEDEDDRDEYNQHVFEQEPQIWDLDFWQQPGQPQQPTTASAAASIAGKKPLATGTTTTTTTTAAAAAAAITTSNNSSIIEPPPILDELKRNSQYNMALNQDTFIKKGRFEIHLNNNNSNHSSNMIESITAVSKFQRSDNNGSSVVVEWKRKSKPTTATTATTATTTTTSLLKQQATT